MTVLEMLNPTTLAVRANVRTGASADKALVADVKANGIIEPIVAYRDGEDVVVMAGHRRTLAAVEAGLDKVPVFLRDQPNEADRITMQVSENQRREALSERDEAAALFELTQKVSDAQAAKRMHVKSEHVAKVKAVFANETAAAQYQEGLDLDTASAFAEFADNEEALAVLSNPHEHGYYGNMTHLVTRLRKDRNSREALAAAAAEYATAGTAVVTDPEKVQGYGPEALEPDLAQSPARLARPDGEPATDEDANAVYLSTTYRGEVTASPVITGWVEAGYADRRGLEPATEPTDEDAEAEAEARRAARRETIENNREMEAANEVRRQWLAEFLSRKTLPKDAALFVARTLVHNDPSETRTQKVAAELLGIPTDHWHPVAAQFEDVRRRPEAITLTLAVATYERQYDKTIWRGPGTYTRAYFAQLIRWGYEASPLEVAIATGEAHQHADN
jgi:ParB family transcriptional regulator, chromosome partitioning protein